MRRLTAFPLALRHAVWATLVLALGVNALIPVGYMLSPSFDGAPKVTLCPDTNPIARLAMVDGVDHAAMGHDEGHQSSGKSTTDCAYSGLAKAATIADDPFLVSLALAFALLLGLAPTTRLTLQRTAYLRPPLRGPPSCI